MLLLIYGNKLSGKKTTINNLITKRGFTFIQYNPNLNKTLVKNKNWQTDYVTILPLITDWEVLKKRPCSRLVIIYAPSNSSWRQVNDDDFYSKLNLHHDACQILNFGSINDLELQVDKCLKKVRPSWNAYFMDIAYQVSHRSNCMKGKVGCVIVRDNRIISTGYNGTPTNYTNCYEDGCNRCNEGQSINQGLEYCFCIHAEESALLFIGKQGCENGSLYVTRFPCTLCCRKILQMGIKKVFYYKAYGESDGKIQQIFTKSGITTEQVDLF